jgi:hypothetical protein
MVATKRRGLFTVREDAGGADEGNVDEVDEVDELETHAVDARELYTLLKIWA